MTGDQGKTLKEEFIDRLEKAKGRLQQSFPEIQQRVKTSSAVEVARKIIDPAQSIFKQFADDIQLKGLFAKAEALVARANPTFSKAVSKDIPPMEASRDETSSNESSLDTGRKFSSRRSPASGRRT